MELEYLSGIELGRLVNRKQMSPVEVIDYFEKRVEKRNPSINAFVYTKFEEARAEAKKLEDRILKGEYGGAFAGVPVGLKDFLPTKKGWTASHGGVKSLITVDDENSMFYEAARALGAIAIGKTNAPSFGFRGTCDNKMYGPTSTPFNTEYNSGGSSGGTAAAVADGLIPMGEGGDAGGSIRVPAAWCNCFGFKPSAGVVPSVCRPDAWSATHPYCCGGPITRTVEDAMVLVHKMVKYNPRDPLSVEVPTDWFKDAAMNRARDLRIGITFDFDLFPQPDKSIVSKMLSAVSALESLGVEVTPVHFQFKHSLEEIQDAWLRGICIDTAIDMELWKRDGFELVHDDVPEDFWYWNQIALSSTMMDYRKFHDIRTDILDAHLDVFNQYDIVLAPVTGCLPVRNDSNGDTKGPMWISGRRVDPLIGFAYTYLENMCGNPAASVPIGLSEEELPIGMQIIGPRYRDPDVFAVARALEAVNPWHYNIPKNRM